VVLEAITYIWHVSAMRMMGFVDNEAIELALIGTMPTLQASLLASRCGRPGEVGTWVGCFEKPAIAIGYTNTPHYTPSRKYDRYTCYIARDPEDDDLWVSKIIFLYLNNMVKLLVHLYLGGSM
jgi:hypothetical protein